ncbi:MAG: hypothetical protein GX442_22650 [Candidatus Riflebacteria bacterium]|nr:hypothetical protein [Candidatus Riflebacteria bacterium]
MVIGVFLVTRRKQAGSSGTTDAEEHPPTAGNGERSEDPPGDDPGAAALPEKGPAELQQEVKQKKSLVLIIRLQVKSLLSKCPEGRDEVESARQVFKQACESFDMPKPPPAADREELGKAVALLDAHIRELDRLIHTLLRHLDGRKP